MNQEDIDAVQFLASEFSKEILTPKSSEQNPATKMETIECSAIEVKTIQEGSHDSENTEQMSAIATLSPEIEVKLFVS